MLKAGTIRFAQIRFRELCFAHIYRRESRIVKSRAFQICPLKIHQIQIHAFEICSGKIRARQVRAYSGFIAAHKSMMRLDNLGNFPSLMSNTIR